MSSKLGNIVANFNSQLSTKLAVGGTTASINSNTDLEGVSIPNGRYFITFDSDNSRKEHFSCVLTRTSSGADLTALKTLNRVTGVETSGALREHKIGAKVTITDFATILKMAQILGGTETLDGSSPLNYDTQPTLSSGLQIATVQFVLDNINGGTVSFDQQIITSQTSGEALTANDIVYFKESDQKWYKADADLTATFDQLQLGIAKSTVAINSGVSIAISGPVAGFTGLTAGSKYYLSNTAGAITTTAGTFSVFIGWALNTTTILFNPLNKTAPTQKEKDALAGSSGVPSSTNKYRTQDNSSSATTDQTQTTQNGTVEVGEADTTTKKNKIAQSFIPVKTKIRGVNLYKIADTGTFTGTVTVSIQADSSGSPSGSALATKTFTNLEYNIKAVGEFEAIFSSEYASLVAGSLYWIVIETSTSDTSNHPNLGTNTAGGYANGSMKYKNTTDSWVAIATIDLYFKTLEGTANQGVSTDDTGKIPNAFYDITKMPTPAFYQEISMGTLATSTTEVFASGSNITGSSLYHLVYESGNGRKLIMYTRDTYTGTYMNTYEVSTSVGYLNETSAIVFLNDYIYIFFDNGTNVGCTRYSGTDLSGETAMTVPVVTAGSTASVTAWTDGRFFYLFEQNTQSTVNKWSLSGTTFSAVGTATSAIAIRESNMSSIFDGTNIYLFNGTSSTGNFGNQINIHKLTSVDGSTVTTTNKRIGKFGDKELSQSSNTNPPVIAAPIDTNRIYIGMHSNVYNATVQMATIGRLFPVTKP